jgi:hypothetical protein
LTLEMLKELFSPRLQFHCRDPRYQLHQSFTLFYGVSCRADVHSEKSCPK